MGTDAGTIQLSVALGGFISHALHELAVDKGFTAV